LSCHFQLIDEGVNIWPLLAELDAQPELWDQHKLRRDLPASPFAAASDIWVRYNDLIRLGDDRQAWNSEHVPVWYPAWHTLPSLRPIVFDLMAKVRGEMLGGVLITKVPAGSRIEMHRDDGWHVQYFDKFYLSLRNPPECAFVCDDGQIQEQLVPRPGEVWLFDNRKPHRVENNGDSDRVTLIMCIRTEMFGRV
jgi:hypothetical protein